MKITGTVIVHTSATGRYRLLKNQREFTFDVNHPYQIAAAGVQCKLTTKELAKLFLQIGTTEPLPTWSNIDR